MARANQPGRGRTALITGASSGIGYELAKCFARDGYNLILVARDVQALARVSAGLQQADGVTVHTIVNDLSRPEAPSELAAELERRRLRVDALVNNAGFGVYGPFANTDWNRERAMLQLHVTTPTELAKRLLPPMLERRHGYILNVASTAAFQPGPLMALYYATKAYLVSFSEALANEVRGSGVLVSALCPGPTETNFQARAGIARSKLFRMRMEAGPVARLGFRGLKLGKTVVIPGLGNRLLTVLVRLLPRDVVTGIVRNVQAGR